MRSRYVFFLMVAAITTAASLSAQSYQFSTDSIRAYVNVLASDSLEGREVGEPGERKAARFIHNSFMSANLEPKGSSGSYFQPFEFVKKIDFGPKNRFVVNGQELKINEDFVPLSQSANTRFDFKEVVPVDYGIKTQDTSYNDYAGKNVEGKAVLIKRFAPSSKDDPHIDFNKYESFADKIATAMAQKVSGIIFVTPAGQDDTLPAAGVMHVTQKEIPILFLKRRGLEKLGLSLETPLIKSAAGQTELIPVQDTGYNVVGFLKGKSDTTIIIGAHYDHLGYGGQGSKYTGTERKIHPGADDNGSGTAGLVELARYFSARRDQLQHSLLFIAFSGEEAGVLGSNYFVKHMTIDSGKVRMMLNMDMIGRLKDQEKGLAIFGTGTAAEFKSYFDSLKTDSLKLGFLEPGTGPSDQMPFYNAGIPVLHFFTGAHMDYHTPGDTPDKLDYPGIVKVISLVANVTEHFDSLPRPLTFQKTKDTGAGKERAAYSVSLGVMPDYMSDVKGLKVDGVTPGKPAESAGILKGDIIIRLGEIGIDDIYTYMSALSKFRKGDSTYVLVARAKDTLKLPVVFR